MNENNMQHGYDYSGQNIDGWYASEKYNGCRAYWDGFNMWSRGGLIIPIPQSWRQALPIGIHLDGEIYDGIDGVYRCGAAVRYGYFSESMSFMVFDCPTIKETYFKRMEEAGQFSNNIVKIVQNKTIATLEDAIDMMRGILVREGEGIILRHPELRYYSGRTDQLLKLKDCSFISPQEK